jgi:S-formylglutathione hydrolase FrmB
MKMPKMELIVKFLIFIPLFFQCGPKVKVAKEQTQTTKTVAEKIEPKLRDTIITINVGKVKCDLAFPDSGTTFKGNILLLQGYNFPKEDWCRKAPQLCKEAAKRGYVMIMPDMGKSVYADTFFTETASMYRLYPLRRDLCKVLFPYLSKNYNLLLEEQSNYVLGLSSGARGAALLVLEEPKLFSAAGLLSGDYDQQGIPKDVIMNLYYGNYEQNKKRWKEIDNIITQIDDWKTPVYIGHGTLDVVVPHAQSKQLNDSLKTRLNKEDLIFNEPVMGHDYKYWGSESLPVLNFFDKHPKK